MPGVSGDPDFWRPVGERLPEAWRKVRLAWPGLGVQSPDPEIRSFDDLTTLAARELNEPCDLLAQSMGGIVAMRLALRHPHNVRRIVLTATSGGLDVTGLGGSDWRSDYLRAHPNAPGWITAERPDHTAVLHKVFQPTLLLWGDADPISPVRVGERLASILPNATLKIIAGGDHMFARDRAQNIVKLIADFLSADG
jgi:pimeloyl-ACP methyl ester carboxylesterase